MDTIKLELNSSEAPSIATTLVDNTDYIVSNNSVVVEPDEASANNIEFRLIAKRNQLFVAPGNDLDLLLNGRPASGPTEVRHGDWVTAGTTAYQIKLDVGGTNGSHRPDRTEESSTSMPTEIPLDTPAAQVASDTRILIGRHKDCTLTIDSPLVSREHARLSVSGGEWSIEDVGSANSLFKVGIAYF